MEELYDILKKLKLRKGFSFLVTQMLTEKRCIAVIASGTALFKF